MNAADLILTPDGCTAEDSRKAAATLADQTRRLGASHADLRETLEALGLVAPTHPLMSGNRDNLGRLRGVPGVIPPGQHGHDGKCASGEHPWVEVNVRTDKTSGKSSCGPCDNARRRRLKREAREARPDLRPLEPGERWCGCKDSPHLLTVGPSATTAIDSRGHRRCKAGKAARQRRARTDAA